MCLAWVDAFPGHTVCRPVGDGVLSTTKEPGSTSGPPAGMVCNLKCKSPVVDVLINDLGIVDARLADKVSGFGRLEALLELTSEDCGDQFRAPARASSPRSSRDADLLDGLWSPDRTFEAAAAEPAMVAPAAPPGDVGGEYAADIAGAQTLSDLGFAFHSY